MSALAATPIAIERMPKHLQERLRTVLNPEKPDAEYLKVNTINEGDARQLLRYIEPNSVALSIWSPPYFVGKSYEAGVTFTDWQNLLTEVIALHFPIIKPGGFLVINIADI